MWPQVKSWAVELMRTQVASKSVAVPTVMYRVGCCGGDTVGPFSTLIDRGTRIQTWQLAASHLLCSQAVVREVCCVSDPVTRLLAREKQLQGACGRLKDAPVFEAVGSLCFSLSFSFKSCSSGHQQQKC